jgi:hypothetical protein
MTRRELAARRRLLAANATLQRVRLVHDVAALRGACRPPRWAGVALALAGAGAALTAAWWARGHTPREPASQATASLWALRGLTLWRAVHALRRVWLAHPSRH